MADGSITNEKDINDVFDDVIFSEDRMIRESFEEGLSKGQDDGKIDGYHLGYHRGLELGTEIGFYKGFGTVLLRYCDSLTFKNREKILNLTKKLNILLENFLKNNCEDVDIMKSIGDIRAYFRKLTSLLKFNLSYPVASSMSF